MGWETTRHRALGLLALVGLCVGGPVAAEAADDLVKRGAYLVGTMGCNDCHTPGYFAGRPDMARTLAGSDVGWDMPGLGYFYGSNLTPDHETGIGTWTDAQVIAAIRTGARPDGRQLAPVMPWRGFAAITDDDAKAIVAYLKSVPAVKNMVPGPFGPGEKPTAPYFTLVMPK